MDKSKKIVLLSNKKEACYKLHNKIIFRIDLIIWFYNLNVKSIVSYQQYGNKSILFYLWSQNSCFCFDFCSYTKKNKYLVRLVDESHVSKRPVKLGFLNQKLNSEFKHFLVVIQRRLVQAWLYNTLRVQQSSSESF